MATNAAAQEAVFPTARLIALTHVPSPRMSEALRTFIEVEEIDLDLAAIQHAEYRRVLTQAGAEVVLLDVNRAFPDAVFVEDTAVVLDEVAVLTSMSAASRRDEPRGIEHELRRHRAEIIRIEPPATLEGGDVLRVGRTLLVGVTERTNVAGIEALAHTVSRFGYEVRRVAVEGCLHLKTACTALPDGSLLVNPRWLDPRDLDGFPVVSLPASEPEGANVVLVGSRVIMSAAHPRTIELVQCRGFDVDAVDISEFAKAEGGVTCLSILVSVLVQAE